MTMLAREQSGPLVTAPIVLDPATAREWIARAARLDPSRTALEDLRVERYWPQKKDRLNLECSYAGDTDRHKCFGELRLGVLTIHSIQDDPQLTQLATCLCPKRMAERLAQSVQSQAREYGDLRMLAGQLDVGASILSYRAGRRATILYQQLGAELHRQWVAKVFRDHRARNLKRLHFAVNEQLYRATGGRIRTTTPVEVYNDLKMIVFDRVRGVAAEGSEGLSVQWVERIAAALGALHECQPGGLRVFLPQDEIGILRRWFGLIESVDPVRAARWRPILAGIERLGSDAPLELASTVHRDCYNAQFMHTHRTTTILDLDTLAKGDPAIDLGNWIAHARLDAARLEVDGRFANACAQLIDAYRRRRTFSDQSLKFYAASSALRLAMVHAFRSATGEHAEALADFARRVCESGLEFENEN